VTLRFVRWGSTRALAELHSELSTCPHRPPSASPSCSRACRDDRHGRPLSFLHQAYPRIPLEPSAAPLEPAPHSREPRALFPSTFLRHRSMSPPWPAGRAPWPPSSLYLRPSSARTDHHTTFATPSRTRGTSSPALTLTGGRCHRTAAVADTRSCGHGAGDRLEQSRVAPRVRKGPWMLAPSLATAAGDPLAGAVSPAPSPVSGGRQRGQARSPLSLSGCPFLCMTGGPGWVTGPTCQFK
jgi:hypothetical protein